jgi:flagellar basal-body rod protein FlgC
MKVEGMFSAMKISSAGLTAQRKRLNAIASNLANAETTRTKEGGPYKKQVVQVSGQNFAQFDEVIEKTKLQVTNTNDKHIKMEPSFIENSEFKVPNAQVVNDGSDPIMIYDPNHPDANADGYVAKPNINVISEMVDMISATRSFEANTSAISAEKTMYKDALDI